MDRWMDVLPSKPILVPICSPLYLYHFHILSLLKCNTETAMDDTLSTDLPAAETLQGHEILYINIYIYDMMIKMKHHQNN